MKEIIGKVHQHNTSKFPRKLFVDKKYITLETEIAKKFNEFFTEISPSLSRKITTPSKPFQSFLKKKKLTINELKDAFFSLKMNFNFSLQTEIFPDPLKIAKANEELIYISDWFLANKLSL